MHKYIRFFSYPHLNIFLIYFKLFLKNEIFEQNISPLLNTNV